MSDFFIQKIAVLGGGSFGTALANIVALNGYATSLWMRNPEKAQACQATRQNQDYLPDQPLAEGLSVTSDLASALSAAQVIVMAIPSHSYRAVVRMAAPLMAPGAMWISATKGIEAPHFTLMSEVLAQELGQVPIGVLSGPNFAKEIAQNQFTASVLASLDQNILKHIPPIFSSKTFRVYSSHDQFGVELAGAIKNIYAIVCGMAEAKGAANNTHAMILTRSLAEMGRFAQAYGANPLTLLGLAGVGDLILTCGSDLSRNYRVGLAIGQGKHLQAALEHVGQTAEGVNTLKIVKEKADQMGIYMPLVQGLYSILFEQADIAQVVVSLMTGNMANDVEFYRP